MRPVAEARPSVATLGRALLGKRVRFVVGPVARMALVLAATAPACRLFESVDGFSNGAAQSGTDGGPEAGGAGGSSGAAGQGGSGGDAGVAGLGGSAGDAGMDGSAGAAGSAGDAGPPPIPLGDFPAAAAKAFCDSFARCTGPALELAFFDEDCTTLSTRILEDDALARVTESIGLGRVDYHPDLAPDCVKTLENVACEDVDLWPVACTDAVEGLVAAGGECERTTECTRDFYCDIGTTCPGTCTARVPSGGACTYEAMCERGLICSQGQCTPPASVGDPCGGSDHPACDFGLLCLAQPPTVGQCVDVTTLFVSPAGVGCDVGAGPLCMEGFHCALNDISGAGVCAPAALSGGPCGIALPDECPVGEYCKVSSGVNGDCTALPGANQPCANSPLNLKPPCEAYHRCVGGLCRPMRRIDEPCEGNGQCYSGQCGTSSTCAPPNACTP